MARTLVICTVAIALLAIWWRQDRFRTAPMDAHPAKGSSTPLHIPSEIASAVPADGPTQTPPRKEPNVLAAITRQTLPDVEVPPWADEMEAIILSHIAQHENLGLTQLQVQCADEGCVVFMGSNNIPVYQMSFDIFAEEHGFNSAIVQSMDGGPNRIVYLRR